MSWLFIVSVNSVIYDLDYFLCVYVLTKYKM